MDNVLDMTEPKAKLRDIYSYMPTLDRYTNAFCVYLADRLDRLAPALVPMEFWNAVELSLSDLSRGVDSSTGLIISNNLDRLPGYTYEIIRQEIPLILDTIFPANFAAQAQQCYEDIQARARQL